MPTKNADTTKLSPVATAVLIAQAVLMPLGLFVGLMYSSGNIPFVSP